MSVRQIAILFYVFLCMLTVGCRTVKPEENLLFLRNNKIEVGILQNAGGRMVVLRRPGHPNLLKESPQLWGEYTAPNYTTPPWKNYQGHITWLAPQYDWWRFQNVNNKMRDANWPPDPYLIFGKYRIIERSKNHLVLESPKSPVWGASLRKTFRIAQDGKLHISVLVTNTSRRNIKWSIWSVARFPVDTKHYVKVKNMKDVLIKELNDKKSDTDVFKPLLHKGLFSFYIKKEFYEVQSECKRKAFLTPQIDEIFAVSGKTLLIMKANLKPGRPLPKGDGAVEIYIDNIKRYGKKGLLELEFVGPYTTLKPGEDTSLEEIWQILPYSEQNIIQYLK